LVTDASLLLPLSDSPLSGIDLTKRMPNGEVETARHGIQIFLLIRALQHRILDKKDEELLFWTQESPIIPKEKDTIDLSNHTGNKIPCTVTFHNIPSSNLPPTNTPAGTTLEFPQVTGKQYYFVVITNVMLLVEPDNNRMGGAVVAKVAPLASIEATTDISSKMVLHFSCHANKVVPRSNNAPLWSATLSFEDHVQCMSAKIALERGRTQLKAKKMQKIAELLGVEYSAEEVTRKNSSSNLNS